MNKKQSVKEMVEWINKKLRENLKGYVFKRRAPHKVTKAFKDKTKYTRKGKHKNDY